MPLGGTHVQRSCVLFDMESTTFLFLNYLRVFIMTSAIVLVESFGSHKPVSQTNWMAIATLTLTDRPNLVCDRVVFEVCGVVFVLSRSIVCSDCIYWGFGYRTESNLYLLFSE